MSFLKKLNIKERAYIAKEFFYDILVVKQHLYAIGISLILSFFVIQSSTPLFSVSATLREAVASSQAPTMGGVTTLLGAKLDIRGAIDEFESNMNSYKLAQRMWNQGWGSKVYGNGDLDEEYFNTIKKHHTYSDRVGAFVLGYELHEYYSPYDLQAYIRGNILANQRLGATNITVSTLTKNKAFAIDFINALIVETDYYSKERLILKSQEIISSTYKQLAVSKNSSIAAALANTINSEYFKIANLENDMPYLVYVIDPPHSSEYPVAPKISAIIVSSAIVFLFFSISFTFIQKNKEDLW